MQINSLLVNHLRKINCAELVPCNEINIIHGRNGSGKTSLLESIHYLATARSFRTSRIGDVISHGESSLLVTGGFKSDAGAIKRIGIEKTKSSTQLRLDGEAITVASKIARHVPILVFNSDSYQLLDGGPANRRALLDRLLFHVEPNYWESLKNYYRALKHRNALLRANAPQHLFEPWDQQIFESASAVDRSRAACIVAINRYFENDPINEGIEEICFDYRRGWPTDETLEHSLQQGWKRDCEVGTTNVGPHRAELAIKLNGKKAKNTVSRGQGKLIIAAIVSAQAKFLKEKGEESPILLVDDLASELDKGARLLAIQRLIATNSQLFLTAIELADLECEPLASAKMFHVEHGAIQSA